MRIVTGMLTIARTTGQVGSALRRFRRKAGLTQKNLGLKMSARQATVSKLESGEAGTQLRILMAALAALDLELVIRPRTKANTDSIEDLF